LLERSLGWLARHASRALAVGVLLGLLVPPLARLAQPLLVPTLMIPLALALVRVDWRIVAAWRRRPASLVPLQLWLLGASPVLVWAVTLALVPLGLPSTLQQALVLMAASSPIVSSVAIALIVGLDAGLAIVAVLLSTALVPFTLPAMAAALIGVTLEMGAEALMLRLVLLVGGAFALAWTLRRLAGPEALARHRQTLDGFTVVNLVVFGLAIMDGVTRYAIEQPGYAIAALAAAYAFNLLLQACGYALFIRLGRRAALTVALVSGNCNMGLVLVALQGHAPFEVTVFFALAQIPMYTLPALLAPLYRRALASERSRAPAR
jgi:BASS family bile acid:Na+ symporter